MKYIFTEVLNDLVNYFFLGDMEALCEWKRYICQIKQSIFAVAVCIVKQVEPVSSKMIFLRFWKR